jgi:manganese efflux pump family protein
MNLLTVLALAVGLAMDAFAVAVATGVSLKSVTGRQTFRLAFHFGLFQALMPVAGWAGGLAVARRLESVDHWIAFALLTGVGGKMLWEALAGKGEASRSDPTKGLSLIVLSVATSLDALAVGLSLSLLKVSIWGPSLIIGLVCAGFTLAGLRLGRVAASTARLEHAAEVLGGLVLIAIGVRILFAHGAL